MQPDPGACSFTVTLTVLGNGSDFPDKLLRNEDPEYNTSVLRAGLGLDVVTPPTTKPYVKEDTLPVNPKYNGKGSLGEYGEEWTRVTILSSNKYTVKDVSGTNHRGDLEVRNRENGNAFLVESKNTTHQLARRDIDKFCRDIHETDCAGALLVSLKDTSLKTSASGIMSVGAIGTKPYIILHDAYNNPHLVATCLAMLESLVDMTKKRGGDAAAMTTSIQSILEGPMKLAIRKLREHAAGILNQAQNMESEVMGQIWDVIGGRPEDMSAPARSKKKKRKIDQEGNETTAESRSPSPNEVGLRPGSGLASVRTIKKATLPRKTMGAETQAFEDFVVHGKTVGEIADEKGVVVDTVVGYIYKYLLANRTDRDVALKFLLRVRMPDDLRHELIKDHAAISMGVAEWRTQHTHLPQAEFNAQHSALFHDKFFELYSQKTPSLVKGDDWKVASKALRLLQGILEDDINVSGGKLVAEASQ